MIGFFPYKKRFRPRLEALFIREELQRPADFQVH